MKFAFTLCIVLFSSSLHAQNIVGLEKGDPAPFEGVLIDKDTAADIIASKEVGDERCDIKLEYEIGKATNSCTLAKEISQANLSAEKQRSEKILALKVREIDRLSEALESASVDWGPAWFAGGALIGVTSSMIIFFIAVQTVNIDVSEI